MTLTHGRIWTLTWILSAGLIGFAACSNETVVEDDGTGGSGTGATSPGGGGSGAGTSSGTATGTSSGTATGTPAGTSSGAPTGMPPCAGCGDFLTDQGTMASDLCGYLSEDASGNVTCDPNTSCSLLADLQLCTCFTCVPDCGDNVCAGLDEDVDCLTCITTACLDEFNACTGDLQ